MTNTQGESELAKGVRSDHTLTRKDLAVAVYAAVSLPRKEATRLVDLVITEIYDALVRDGEVKISGFGTFKVVSKTERLGRNPKSGKAAVITPRRVISFKSAERMKGKINGGNEDADD